MKHSRVSTFIKKNFFTGVAMLFPLFLTAYVTLFIFRFIDGIVGNYINQYLNTHYGFSVPGLGLAFLLAFTLTAGFVYNYFFGDRIWYIIEKIFYKTPFVANIYPSAKELSQFVFTPKAEEKFKKVVSIEFPTKGTYSIGFITNSHIEELNANNEKDLISVFVPLAPTPISGHILLVPKAKVKELDISVDRAIKFVVSGGVVLSEKIS